MFGTKIFTVDSNTISVTIIGLNNVGISEKVLSGNDLIQL